MFADPRFTSYIFLCVYCISVYAFKRVYMCVGTHE
jgi:cbb3-type cytochrome oxidase subunit 3